MKIVLASHSAEGPVFRVGSHHYARELAAAGHDVLHLSTGWSTVQAMRAVGRPLDERSRTARSGPVLKGAAWHAVPSSIIPMRWGGGRRSSRRILEATGFERPDALVIDQPMFSALARGSGARTVVYRPTDAHPHGTLRRHEEAVLGVAHGIAATSAPVLASLPHHRSDMPEIVIENGVEFHRFVDAPSAPRDGVVYVGAIDTRFDWATVAAVARSVPGAPVRIAGPVVQAAPPDLPVNVQLLGPVGYDEVPALLARSAVGILPLSSHALNAGRSPMKYYEYLAAGLYVVAQSTDALAGRSAPGVSTYGSADEAGEMVGHYLSRPTGNDEGRASAAQHDWRAKAETLVRFIEKVTP